MSGMVLVIEDEVDLATTLEYNLKSEGFQVKLAHSGRQGLAAATSDPTPDVIVLDLMLPDLAGTEICRRLREQDRTRDVPVIMCTAKGEEIDRVVGFEVGADDYVVKPFSVRELVLRIRALLRRAQRTEGEPSLIRFGRLKIDRDAHRAWVDEAEVGLTALEFRLLHAFLSRRGRVQTRDALLSAVWGIDADVTTRTVDTHV
jgi:two-component system phosphate regulon response regulator PhoB